ncbi:hypothetical protein [Rhizobium laguerreae]|uniref:Uncharacterized protein n=1 Tax=Rhizobium laguerreae TaxID=1076926 RepID=A0A7Y2RBM2_9HYPH|nr:hypothetical protein [Rhizobium laguerreae]NNH67996.1 hypothetical protein [Rhizobium laguerreae]
MSKNSFLEWDTTASNNTDLGGIGIQGTNAVSNFDNALRTLMAQLRAGLDGKVVYASKSGNYTALGTDNNAVHRYTATATVALTAAATLAANWHYTVVADGAAVTIDPNASETINGLTTLIVPNGSTATIICDGSSFFTVIKPNGWQTIENRSFSAVSNVDFTNLGAFKRLRLTGSVTLSGSSTLAWRSSTNNGSSYDAGASDYYYQLWAASGVTTSSARTGPTTFGAISAGTYASFTAILENFSVSGAGALSTTTSTCLDGAVSTLLTRQDGAIRDSNTARNALRILPSTAVTLTGNILIEGSIA